MHHQCGASEMCILKFWQYERWGLFMRNLKLLAGVSFSALMLGSGLGWADGMPSGYAVPAGIGIDFEVGARYWYSTGKYKLDLFAPGGSAQVSRLTYDNLTASSAEAFFRADVTRSFFVKGIVGGGSVTGGKMNDEDFPPFLPVYTNTLSQQRDGNLSYFNADVGYNLLNNSGYTSSQKLGAFVGYGYWRERLNTFGCDQLNPPAVNESCNHLGNQFNGLDNDAAWRMLRLGLAGEATFGRWKLSGEAAYVRGRADVTDWHNLRPDIRGLREDATGDGVQAEAILSYFITPSFSVGAGVRYWHIAGDGTAHFEDKGGPAEPIHLTSDRFGAFVQGSLKLAEGERLASVKDTPYRAPPSWTGGYVGVNVGYGTSDTREDINGTSALGIFLANDFLDKAAFQNVDTKGFFGGGQAGYNVQVGRGVVGIEGDIDWAHDSGSTGSVPLLGFFFVNPVFNQPVPLLTSVDQQIEALATLRARLGYLVSPHLLMYVTGGLAVGETRLSLNVRDIGIGPLATFNNPCNATTWVCSRGTSSGLSVGYTLGGGVEYKLSEGISIKGEYLFVDLGSRSVTTTDVGFAAASNVPANFKDRAQFDANLFRVGLNVDLYRPVQPLK
jgi:opacity protein-like surface antigen